MITYNHEKYIAEAIEGVLMQDVDFEVELVIADDASTDRTGEIVNQFIQNHPRGNWIKYTRHDQNKGMMPNFVWALYQCKGDFIALCEGDDYWIDENKLFKQAHFLIENDLISLVYHPVLVLSSNFNLHRDTIAERFYKARISSIYDLALFGNFIHTPSVVFRKANLSLVESFKLSPIGDFFLYILLARNGYLARMDFFGAVYRNFNGSYSSKSFIEKKKAFRKTLYLIGNSIDNTLVSFILKIRINHNSLIGKVTCDLEESSEIDSWYTFFNYVNKIELLKGLFKLIFYRTAFK